MPEKTELNASFSTNSLSVARVEVAWKITQMAYINIIPSASLNPDERSQMLTNTFIEVYEAIENGKPIREV